MEFLWQIEQYLNILKQYLHIAKSYQDIVEPYSRTVPGYSKPVSKLCICHHNLLEGFVDSHSVAVKAKKMLGLLGRCQSLPHRLHDYLLCVASARGAVLKFSWPRPRRGAGMATQIRSGCVQIRHTAIDHTVMLR